MSELLGGASKALVERAQGRPVLYGYRKVKRIAPAQASFGAVRR